MFSYIRGFLLAVLLLCGFLSNSQVVVSGANVGNGTYANLGSAFTAVNSGSQSGATISISVSGSTVETASAVLNAGAWNSITIQPSGGSARTIYSIWPIQIAIDLNGADNVTIDGLNSGGNSLTIDHENIEDDCAAIRFINDAKNNTIKRCTILNSSQAQDVSGQGAVIWFSTAASSGSGNDNNTISYCNITGAYIASIFWRPSQGIRSNGTSGRTNDNNTIDHCNIYDFGTDVSDGASIGINVADYSSGWTISNNKIYETSALSFSTSLQEWKGIYINVNNTTNAGGFTISGNTVGYANSSGTGTSTFAGGTNMVYGIVFNAVNSGTTSTISSNTIAGIDQTSSRAPTTTSGPGTQVFTGVLVKNGPVSVTGNIIGSTSGTGSITVRSQQTSAATTTCVAGILNMGSSDNSISDNQIGGIAVTYSSGGSQTESFVGIRNESTGTVTISGNTIGNSTASNITSNETGAGLIGINLASSSGTITVSSNTIQNFRHTAANTGTGATASVIGVLANGSGGTYTITQNSINTLANNISSSSAVNVYAICLNQSGSGHSVSRNKIYDLSISNSNSSTSAELNVIRFMAGTVMVSNNMAHVGNSITCNPAIYALNVQGGAPAIYFNTIYLSGTASGTASNTQCFRMQNGSNGTVVVDNIFFNDRTSATAANNQTMYFSSITQRNNVTTCNYNDLYKNASNTNLVTVVGGASSPYSTLANWQLFSGKDANSLSQSVAFISTLGSNIGFLHINRSSCSYNLAGTPVSGITIDFDGDSRSAATPSMGADEIGYVSWTGATNTDWNTSGNWNNGLIPTIYYDVNIPSGLTNYPVISAEDAICHSVTINTGASLTMQSNRQLTLDPCSSSSSFSNSGTFSAGTGTETVVFNGSGTVSGTTGTTFNQVTIKGGVDFKSSSPYSTISKQLEIQSGGYVTTGAAPYYSTGSILMYNTGGSFTAGEEWFPNNICSNRGVPYHVTITGSTSLSFGSASYYREMCGDLSIANGSSLILSSTPGGDLYIKGNWTNAGTFTPNCRSVKFNSAAADQTITKSSGGTETFNYLSVDKSGYKLKLGTNTNVKVDATNTCGLGGDYLTITNGDIDLNGRTLYLSGPTGLVSGTLVMNIKVLNGTRSILSSVSGGVVSLSSTLNSKTALVVNGGGSGKILFGDNVEVQTASGEIDFGSGNLGTLNYILRLNSGGAVVGNACYYAQNSKLVFSTGTVYDIVATQQVWESGTSGATPGVPWNVEVNASGTDVRTNDNADRAVRNDISILSGTFELGATGFLLGNLTVGGDWVRNASGTSFVPNQNKVTFNSAVNAITQLQTITMSGDGNETFYDLELNNSSGLTLSGTTNAYVNHQLTLTSGLFNTGSNEVYVTSTASNSVTGHYTDQTQVNPLNYTASSHINGNLRRNVVAATGYDFPLGTSSNYQLATLYFTNVASITNVLGYFTSGISGTFNSCTINYTPVIGMLNAGYWTLTPTGSMTGVNYDVTLYETGFTGFTGTAISTGVIKRTGVQNWSGTDFGSSGTHTNSTQQMYQSNTIAKVVRTSVPSFSDFAIGYSNGTALPIEVTTFTASLYNDDAVIEWNTSAEYNTVRFAVQRSLDGKQFIEIGSVQAAGFSALPLKYSFIDPAIRETGADKIYYRLQVFYTTEEPNFTEVRWINLTGAQSQEVLVYPNPFSERVNVSWKAEEKGTAIIQIEDAGGKLISQYSVEVSAGSNFFTLNQLSPLPQGLYLLSITEGHTQFISKLLKQ